MERQTFCIVFYIKNKKKLKNKQAPIYMRVTINGQRWDLSLKRSMDPDLWDENRIRIKGKTSSADELNDYLELMKRKIYEIRKELIDDNIDVIMESINICTDLALEKGKWNIEYGSKKYLGRYLTQWKLINGSWLTELDVSLIDK